MALIIFTSYSTLYVIEIVDSDLYMKNIILLVVSRYIHFYIYVFKYLVICSQKHIVYSKL